MTNILDAFLQPFVELGEKYPIVPPAKNPTKRRQVFGFTLSPEVINALKQVRFFLYLAASIGAGIVWALPILIVNFLIGDNTQFWFSFVLLVPLFVITSFPPFSFIFPIMALVFLRDFEYTTLGWIFTIVTFLIIYFIYFKFMCAFGGFLPIIGIPLQIIACNLPGID